MKLTLFKINAFIAFIALSAHIWAQDIIVTNNAKKIDAKILEVSTSEIRYKELDNLDGPVFILRTDEVNSIIYANGKVVLYKPIKESAEGSIDAQKDAEALAKANQLGSLFSKTTSAEKQGNPIDCGIGYGSSWSMAGRGIKGTLPQPTNDFKQEGKIVVQIRVNAAGNVIDAYVVNGTTITDKHTRQLALEAAKRAKFTEDDHEQIGTITYIFKLN